VLLRSVAFSCCVVALALGCSSRPSWPPPECTERAPLCSDASSCEAVIASLATSFPGKTTGLCWQKYVSDLAQRAGGNVKALEALCDDRQGSGDSLVACAALRRRWDHDANVTLATNWRVLANMLAVGDASNARLRRAVKDAMLRDQGSVRSALAECDGDLKSWQAAYLVPDVVQGLPLPDVAFQPGAEHWPERRSVARTLGFAGDPRAEPTLVHLTQDPWSFSTRVAAVVALGRLSQLSDVGASALERATRDPVERVRIAAVEASKQAGGKGHDNVRALVSAIAHREAPPGRDPAHLAPNGTLASLVEKLEEDEDVRASPCSTRLYHPPEGDWTQGQCGNELTTSFGSDMDLVELSTDRGQRVRLGQHDFEVPAAPKSAHGVFPDGIVVLCESGDLNLFARSPDRLVWSRCLTAELDEPTNYGRTGTQPPPTPPP
jgi:hypothetical protein